MATKKSTTKKQTTGNQKSRAELRKQLARDIASITSNPECPARIYNGLADGILEVFNSTPGNLFDTSEEYILSVLNAFAAADEKGETY
jgi:hypothetical protein